MHREIFILTFVGLIFKIKAQPALFWNNHVYTGRHFDDYVTRARDGQGQIIGPTLLVMYNSRCENNIKFLKKEILPPNFMLTVLFHDYEKFPSWIWYKFDDRDDLTKRYKPIRSCPEYLYFANGTNITQPERFNERRDRNPLLWLFDKLNIEFQVTNKMPRPIKIHFDTMSDHAQRMVVINPGDTAKVKSYTSNLMFISERNKFVYAAVIDGNLPEKIVIRAKDSMDLDIVRWLKRAKKEISLKSAEVRNWRHSIASQYLLGFKQPVILPKFTKTGFAKREMPEDLRKDILKYYVTNYKLRITDEHENEPLINDSEVKCSAILMDDELKQRIHDVMQPLLERWCNCTLEGTDVYGIREFYEGNVIRNTVDAIENHVISVLFQIHKDLRAQPDWPMEVIDFNGKRKQIYMKNGDMLFYESATIIHGRPSPFQGYLFANVYVHFRPTHKWPWAIQGTHITKNGQKYEPTNIMTDVSGQHPKYKSYHDEL